MVSLFFGEYVPTRQCCLVVVITPCGDHYMVSHPIQESS